MMTKIPTFFVSFKIDVTGETSRSFGENTRPKADHRIPILGFAQWLLGGEIAPPNAKFDFNFFDFSSFAPFSSLC